VVELYDYAIVLDPAHAATFIEFPIIVVRFRASGWPVWLIVIISILGVLALFFGAVVIARWYAARCNEDDEEEEDDYEDQTAVSGASDYHILPVQ
jgi:flagellar biosynthesis/type III secretory pathway M-ring protein FliF/YscJ